MSGRSSRTGKPSRRQILAATAGLALSLVASAVLAQAQPPAGANSDSQVVGPGAESKEPVVTMDQANALSWLVGDKLSLAAILYAQGDDDDEVASNREMAINYAGALHFAIHPFPDRQASPVATLRDMVTYLMEGDGSQLGIDLGKRFGYTAGLLFETAVSSNLLIALYVPGDDSGLGALVQSRCIKLNLPQETWKPLIEAIGAKMDVDTISDLVFKMHDDISQDLAKRAAS